jgi:hypothetical protein
MAGWVPDGHHQRRAVQEAADAINAMIARLSYAQPVGAKGNGNR